MSGNIIFSQNGINVVLTGSATAEQVLSIANSNQGGTIDGSRLTSLTGSDAAKAFRALTVPFTITTAVGDPYIQPINGGEVWKMANFQGNSRMLEGCYKNKELIINVQTTISSAEEARENKEYSKMMLKKIGMNLEDLEKKGLLFDDTGEAFMRKMWVKYGDHETFINMEELTVSNTDDFKTKETKDFARFKKYDCHEAESIEVNIVDGLSLIVSKYPNPQVRTGFSLRGNVKQIKKGKGHYVINFIKKIWK